MRLLRFAARFGPYDNSDWPQAMVAELHFIGSDWSALFWALGASGVLAKRALLALFLRRKSPGVRLQAELLSSEVSMRKATLFASGLSVLAALLFFVAPQFRQAFQVSLSAWHEVFHIAHTQPELGSLAKRAWAQHDAEGLAFAAVRIWDDEKSASWVNEAVRLDPKLIWVYAVVAVRHSANPEIKNWLPKLESWDPQNALFHLIKAECIDIDYVVNERAPGHEDGDPDWVKTMNAAFRSQKFDDYLDRLRVLDRRVAQRYPSIDPAEVLLGGNELAVPTYAF